MNEDKSISKGEKLRILLDKADEIHTQMNYIFIRNGLNYPELKQLSPADREEWYNLKAESDILEKEITGLILEREERKNL